MSSIIRDTGMKYWKFALLFYSHLALAQITEVPRIPNSPGLPITPLKKLPSIDTTFTKNLPDAPKPVASDKTIVQQNSKVPASTPSIQKLLKLGYISTQQSGNTNLDIKTADLIKVGKPVVATSLVQISNVRVTSFTRTAEKISDVPAAMYVITGDEIKRMGVQQLANTLRYAPGVAVVQAGAGSWYIAVRGFNSSTTNKLLVLIDGRSIYSTLYGGVLWQEQDYFLEDIDRIEIIRGPGGVIWGANAVNGVINIITKNSKNTQGILFSVGGGDDNQLGEVRIGKKIAKNTYGRFYVKTSHLNKSSNPLHVDDDGVMLQSGFRMDKLSGPMGDLTFSGDIYKGGIGPKLNGLQKQILAQEYTGNNLLLNWSYNASEKRNHQVLTYLDYTNLNASGILIDKRRTFHIQYQLSQKLHSQQIIAGVNYRRVSDDIPTISLLQFIPKSRIDQTYGGFIQDDINFLRNKAHFIVGTKYECNNYTGSEWQPSVRGTYSFKDDSLLWAAISRAVRIPTRLEENFNFPPFLIGNTKLLAESALVYEAGWRKKMEKVSFDITAYTSNYIDLLTIEGSTEGNKMSGRISGMELSPSFQLKPGWLVRFNYSFATNNMHVSDNSLDISAPFLTENSYPKNMAEIISMWDINSCWQLNTYLRYMDSLKVRNALQTVKSVPSYLVADISIVWKQNKTFNWQLVGRNLGKKHFEWGSLDSSRVAPSIALYFTVNLA